MQKLLILVLAVSSAFINHTARSDVKVLSWFSNVNFSELTIAKFKSVSGPEIVSSVTIKDKIVIKEMITRIQSLPVNGEEMRRWGPKTKLTKLYFSLDGKDSQTIEIYENKFKTPATGFLEAAIDIETMLSGDIEALVAPELGVRIPKFKDLPIKFKEFTISYTGTKATPQASGGPTVGPTNECYFSIWENGSANRVSVSIFDGQIPPQPQAFVIGKKVFYLLTYQGLSNESLSPKYFVISDRLPKGD